MSALPVDSYLWLSIIGLTAVTVVVRSFFFMSQREFSPPPSIQKALRYAPAAALAAIISPEIVMVQGQLISSWQHAKLVGALCATLYFFFRQRSLLGTIIVGTGSMLLLHVGLQWPL